jgi:hypothetical protein
LSNICDVAVKFRETSFTEGNKQGKAIIVKNIQAKNNCRKIFTAQKFRNVIFVGLSIL